MSRFAILLLISFFSISLYGKIFVFPFKVLPESKKETRWLGRGVSRYLSLGLEKNGFDSVDDEVLCMLLNKRNILFPYKISKATAISLSRNWEGNYLISGEVSFGEKEGDVQLKCWIIDVINLKQFYSPLFKGRVDNIIDVQMEMLRFILNTISRGDDRKGNLDILDMSNHAYEIFVKAELIQDSRKRLRFLKKAVKDFKGSEAFHFAIAKELYRLGNYRDAKKSIAVLKGDLSGRTRFLKALIFCALKENQRGEELFREIGKEWYFPCETSNNLGVLSFQKGYYEEAEKFFRKALNIRKHPVIYLNLIKNLLKQNRIQEARRFVSIALGIYPSEKTLIELFQYFITVSDEKYRNMLLDVFQEKVPELHFEDKLPRFPVKFLNPFSIDSRVSTAVAEVMELEAVENGDLEEEIEKYSNLLEANPFVDGYYRNSATLLTMKKQFYRGEIFIRAALWLNPTLENYFALLKIFNLAGKIDEAEDLKKEMEEDFGEGVLENLKD